LASLLKKKKTKTSSGQNFYKGEDQAGLLVDREENLPPPKKTLPKAYILKVQ